MLLSDWLKQDHRLGNQLPVMDSLCQGVTAAHRRTPARTLAMDPQKINVAGNGDCQLLEGTTPAAYRAPETLPGAPASKQADIYSLGVMFYQMLARKHPAGPDARAQGGEPPRPVPLRDVRPDVPRDLVDAIMACLEPDPEWRPKDLEYLLSVVRRVADEHPESAGPSRSAPATPPKGAAPKTARRASAPEPRSSPVALGALVVALLVVAGVGWWYATRQPPAGPTEPGPTPLPAVSPVPQTPPPALPSPSALPSRPPVAVVESVAPPVAPSAAPSVLPATPSPGRATPSPVVVRSTPPPPPPTPVAATPVPSPTVTRVEATPEPPPPPAEPAVLSTLSPPRVKKPGNAIVDVRGTGLRADHLARIVRGREQAAGIQILRQRFVSPNLIQVALRLEDTAAPGSYQLYLIDGQGTSTNARALEVVR